MNQIIDEAYENYHSHRASQYYGPYYSKEEFINRIKTDSEFSEKWGLKIEERGLDMMERWGLADLTPNMTEFGYCNKLCDEHNVPTKLITITYKEEKFEFYEN